MANLHYQLIWLMPSYRVLPLPLPPLTQHHSISIHLPFLNSIRQRLLIDASRTESELELFNILSNLIEIEIHYNSTACRSSIVLIKKVDISIEIPRFFCSFFFFKKLRKNEWKFKEILEPLSTMVTTQKFRKLTERKCSHVSTEFSAKASTSWNKIFKIFMC